MNLETNHQVKLTVINHGKNLFNSLFYSLGNEYSFAINPFRIVAIDFKGS